MSFGEKIIVWQISMRCFIALSNSSTANRNIKAADVCILQKLENCSNINANVCCEVVINLLDVKLVKISIDIDFPYP